MKPEDWAALEMRPPSANHDPFHGYVTLDGGLTDKGRALGKFYAAMLAHAYEIGLREENRS